MTADQTATLTGYINPVSSAITILTVLVSGTMEDSTIAKSNYRLVISADSTGYWKTLLEFASSELLTGHSEQIDTLEFEIFRIGEGRVFEPTNNDSTWSDDSISGSERGLFSVDGYLMYYDPRDPIYVMRPAANVRVEVMDDDGTSGDDLLGVTETDWDGHYHMDGLDTDDCWGCGNNDPYIKFMMKNGYYEVCKTWFGTYSVESARSFGDVGGGITLDFGTDALARGNFLTMPMWIYQFAGEGRQAMTAAGYACAPCKFNWPEEKSRYISYFNEVQIASDDCDAIDVVNHEYGHFIMDCAYDDDDPAEDCPDRHYIESSHNTGCAWSEGWADFFALVATPDGIYNFGANETALSIENTGAFDPGPACEGRVAGALLDLWDANVDGKDSSGTYSCALQSIFSSIVDDPLPTFEAYWNHLKANSITIPQAYRGIRSIANNTIDYAGVMRGDCDADNNRNVSDIVYVINYIFNGGPAPVPNILAGDMDCNGIITISDQVFYINWMFASGPPPCTLE